MLLKRAGGPADALPVEPSEHPRAPGAVLEQCPHCRGAVRPDAPWCTQCWTDLRPAPPAPEPVLVPALPATDRPAASDRSAAAPVARGGWPCTTCAHVNAVEHDACASCGADIFASLRAGEQPLLVLPGVGDLTRYSRGQRLAVAGGVVAAVCLVVALLGLLLG